VNGFNTAKERFQRKELSQTVFPNARRNSIRARDGRGRETGWERQTRLDDVPMTLIIRIEVAKI
jgi:hypothetical protein